jgi:secondary thiamine-phosphate synthase enzyme
MVVHSDISVATHSRCEWIDISQDVSRAVTKSGIRDGICCVASVHTTAGITINENADPDVGKDFLAKLSELIPKNGAFRHVEGNSDSHLKASLVGLSVTVPVREGCLVLGTWQSVYFCEFDGPRRRIVSMTIIGEK